MKLRLKKNEDRRLRAGHLWIYANEVDVKKTPLTALSPGQPVVIERHDGRPLGTAYANPSALICARMMSTDDKAIDFSSLLKARLLEARSIRERLFEAPYYRLVHGEADLLPGLIIDRYGEVLVGQINTFGMELLRPQLEAELSALPGVKSLLWKNESTFRKLEGLEQKTEVGFGAPPTEVRLLENNLHFWTPLHSGQKTGWFFDQRDNRARLGRYVKGASVLDVFSYVGGWAAAALAGGASAALAVDASSVALEYAKRNAPADKSLETRKGDAFDVLKALAQEAHRFDVVVVDPPAFIKRKRDLKEGKRAYERINQLAMELLQPGGFLISCSCSYHLSRDALLDALRRAADRAGTTGRGLSVLEPGYQAADHPVHPAMEETEYLKGFFCVVR